MIGTQRTEGRGGAEIQDLRGQQGPFHTGLCRTMSLVCTTLRTGVMQNKPQAMRARQESRLGGWEGL